MEISVRYFASLAERAGCSHESLTLERPGDVRQLWERLQQRHPGLAEAGPRPMVACDMEYADWDRSLEGVKEVAFLPPVSGG